MTFWRKPTHRKNVVVGWPTWSFIITIIFLLFCLFLGPPSKLERVVMKWCKNISRGCSGPQWVWNLVRAGKPLNSMNTPSARVVYILVTPKWCPMISKCWPSSFFLCTSSISFSLWWIRNFIKWTACKKERKSGYKYDFSKF